MESAVLVFRVGRETVSLRPETPDDDAFLLAVYASSRESEMRRVPWTDEQKGLFLASQFRAQRDAYRSRLPDASYDVIVVDGASAGRLYVHRGVDQIELIDIALLPPHRNAGIGTRLVTDLMDEAAIGLKAVRLYVEHDNPARRLYDRLGFRQIGDVGVYAHMEWRSPEVSIVT